MRVAGERLSREKGERNPGSAGWRPFFLWLRWCDCDKTSTMRILGRLAAYVDLIPIGLVVILTFCFTVEVPVSDDWELVPIIQKIREGTLDWKTLDTPFEGHKFVVPYLVLGGLAVVTHWNTYVFRVVNLLMFIGAWLAIRPMAVRGGQLLAASLVFWSWDQWSAWLWFSTMYCTMALLCVLWSLRLLTTGRSGSFVAAMMLAVVGTFCHGAGLTVWPAAAYLMFFTPRPVAQRIAFTIIMAAAAYLFLQHPGTQAMAIPGKKYSQMPFFFLQALGAPVGCARMGVAAADHPGRMPDAGAGPHL